MEKSLKVDSDLRAHISKTKSCNGLRFIFYDLFDGVWERGRGLTEIIQKFSKIMTCVIQYYRSQF